MRLRDPIIPDWIGYILAAPIVAAAIPVLAAGFIFGGLIWIKRQFVGPHKEWSDWFAWYPVRAGWDGTRWLETVERRSYGVMTATQYRAKEPNP